MEIDVRQRRRTAAVMAPHQAAHTAVAPCVRPVVDALYAHTKLLGNDWGLILRPSISSPPLACACHDARD
ncbi:hypothetical protein SAMN05446935_7109 [Burkholderia sp. YR290]|jgi:hypothetical protein|uniref:Uncharacterized protein n=1 Tax=Paraburkholderia hospita TaxID=169430 RepID=A0ABN0FAW1_9BURK|nr:hypothetical protein WQE_38159 [Paraburkholderia hospita]SEI25738.1 hypothetical protein SAMN05192544_106141 [Paraburkholderia hospita]SKC91280.1 hypothetical protein SAMN05446934_5768 [Paraburkholderia hospita]SOE86597.1 hypothetical protein SAMN05446935_7109 [Burkholderia sp. YR290]